MTVTLEVDEDALDAVRKAYRSGYTQDLRVAIQRLLSLEETEGETRAFLGLVMKQSDEDLLQVYLCNCAQVSRRMLRVDSDKVGLIVSLPVSKALWQIESLADLPVTLPVASHDSERGAEAALLPHI